MNITPKALGAVFAAVIAATVVLAPTAFAKDTDSNANRTPKTMPSWTAYPPCTTVAYKNANGRTVKSCIKKPDCLCP